MKRSTTVTSLCLALALAFACDKSENKAQSKANGGEAKVPAEAGGAGGGAATPEAKALAEAPAANAANAIGATGATRTIEIVNQCEQPVWLGTTTASLSCKQDSDCAQDSCVRTKPGDAVGHCTCTKKNTDCGFGVCNEKAGICYWPILDRPKSKLELEANGGSITVTTPDASGNSSNFAWSGNIFARTHCDSQGQNCWSGECGNKPNEACPPFKGPGLGVSLAEFTFPKLPTDANKDFYDVSILNGINVGVAMQPDAGSFAPGKGSYHCAGAGAKADQADLRGCSWAYTPEAKAAPLLTKVRPCTTNNTANHPVCAGFTCKKDGNGLDYMCSCESDADCGDGFVCGTSQNASKGVASLGQVCGAPVGFYTMNDFCQFAPDYDKLPVDCGKQLHNGTLASYFGCSGVQGNSCYNKDNVAAGHETDCCGCATDPSNPLAKDWPSVLGLGDQCYGNSPDWASDVQPWLVALKQTCPTAYTYPFDDATSTFTCTRKDENTNPTYTITFCPEKAI